MANHRRRRLVAGLGEPEMQACVEAAANRIVGDLLCADAVVGALVEADPPSDADFSAYLVDRELGLIADGESPLRVALSVAVLRCAREAVCAYADIRALPETATRRSTG